VVELARQKKIRVAWFASGFIGRYASGTAQTAKKIITNLINNHSDEVQVILVAKNDEEVQLIQAEKLFLNVEIILLPRVYGKKFGSARQFYKFCILKRTHNLDILHYSVPRVYPFFYLFPAKKIVCTFHAGGDITAPKDYFVLSREIYNYIIKMQWRKFASIIADSKFAADEIALAYRIPIKFIKIIYIGADNLWGNIDEKFDRDVNCIVLIGRWQNYKNLHAVINAFKKFEIPKNQNLKLKVIGKSGLKNNKMVLDALEGFPKNQIELVEYLSDSDLAKVYRKASVVFHPSINEGFGLPAFEAFGEGARVIAHNGTPADQILNSQEGILFDDLLDETKIVNSYRTILTQNFGNLIQRRLFIESIDATWALSTKKYVDLYKDILK